MPPFRIFLVVCGCSTLTHWHLNLPFRSRSHPSVSLQCHPCVTLHLLSLPPSRGRPRTDTGCSRFRRGSGCTSSEQTHDGNTGILFLRKFLVCCFCALNLSIVTSCARVYHQTRGQGKGRAGLGLVQHSHHHHDHGSGCHDRRRDGPDHELLPVRVCVCGR